MVRVGDAHIGGGLGGDVGDHIVVDLAVIGIQPQVYGDVGVEDDTCYGATDNCSR